MALVLPPYYYKPVSDEGLVAWYARLHEALGDRPIAIYFYNFPQMTGLPIPVSVIGELHRRWTAAGYQSRLVTYPDGGHGFGMEDQGASSDGWIEEFYAWLTETVR